MKFNTHNLIKIAFLIVIFFALNNIPALALLKAGAGRMEITPSPGCYLGGYYFLNKRSTGVHDPLYARALVLDDGTTRIALITLDLIIIGGVMASEIKEMIKDKLDIPVENINVSVTHTHTGPEGYYEEFGKYPKEYAPDMKQSIENKTLEAVRLAVANLVPAAIGFESFTVEGLNHNRHDPDGPADHTAVLAVVKNDIGTPIIGFLNFAAHPTVVPAEQLLISGEWTGMFQSLMEQKLGQSGVFLYLQGASGNLGPGTRDVGDGWKRAQNMAERMTDIVFPRLQNIKTLSDVRLSAVRKEFVFDVRTKKGVMAFSRSIPEQTKQIESSDIPQEKKNRRIGWLKERYGVESSMQMMIPTMKRVKKGKTNTLIQAMRIGDLLLVSFPGEAVTELSIAIRRELAPRTVAVLGYSNDHLGYITPQSIYEEGGYEAGMGLVYPEATQDMFDGLLELAKELINLL